MSHLACPHRLIWEASAKFLGSVVAQLQLWTTVLSMILQPGTQLNIWHLGFSPDLVFQLNPEADESCEPIWNIKKEWRQAHNNNWVAICCFKSVVYQTVRQARQFWTISGFLGMSCEMWEFFILSSVNLYFFERPRCFQYLQKPHSCASKPAALSN